MITFKEGYNIVQQDSARQIQDTTLKKIIIPADTTGISDTLISVTQVDTERPVQVIEESGPEVFSLKNRVGDIIYSQYGDSINGFYHDGGYILPFKHTGINGQKGLSSSAVTIPGNLREGTPLPDQPFNDDWIIAVALVSAFIYSTLTSYHGRLLNNIKTFLLFKNIADPVSRERGSFFHWSSILINLISFANISLFAYLGTDYHNFIPMGISGISLWLIFMVSIVLLVILRHFTCYLIGNITGQETIFSEYCTTVYQSYHITGFIFFIISVLMAYTGIFDPGNLLITGLIFAIVAYLMRIMRLLLIFIKCNISLFYLILYLCALEFLPALVALRYFKNLF